MQPRLPEPIGPLSQHVHDLLVRPGRAVRHPSVAAHDALADDDLQRALACCYELHYRGFAGVPADAEWDPDLLRFRASLEQAFTTGLFDAVGPPAPTRQGLPDAVHAALAAATGPSLSTYVLEQGTLAEFREFAMHRSAYQLKEADAHTWAIPRLAGDAKAALVHIQGDEYGGGRPALVHATLFADTMRALGLDDTYGTYLPVLPGTTLATDCLVSMLGLHRRWRGALVGHLTVFEMTSVAPMGRYSRALARLGLGASARRFYDVHVLADAEHQVVALEAMAASLARDEPELVPDLLFGVRAVLEVERRFATALLDAWTAGRSSLRQPLPQAA